MKYFKLIILLIISQSAFSQTAIIKQDINIKNMVNDVSAKNVEATVRKLVSFGTRHTLSDTTSKTIGIGAARNWIKFNSSFVTLRNERSHK